MRNKIFNTAHMQLQSLREMLLYHFKDDTIGVYAKTHFKPVFYIRPDALAAILELSTDIGHFTLGNKGKLFDVDVYLTPRPDAPDIALALEPIEAHPFFGNPAGIKTKENSK